MNWTETIRFSSLELRQHLFRSAEIWQACIRGVLGVKCLWGTAVRCHATKSPPHTVLACLAGSRSSMAAVGWGVLKLSAAHSLDVHHKGHRNACWLPGSSSKYRWLYRTMKFSEQQSGSIKAVQVICKWQKLIKLIWFWKGKLQMQLNDDQSRLQEKAFSWMALIGVSELHNGVFRRRRGPKTSVH